MYGYDLCRIIFSLETLVFSKIYIKELKSLIFNVYIFYIFFHFGSLQIYLVIKNFKTFFKYF